MAKIPFDIKFKPQIESGEYNVETRDGKPVRIICWDKQEYAGQREEPTPIVYLLLSEGGCEHIMSCTTDGMFPDGRERNCDLFIVIPGPELSEFEKGCIRLYQDGRDDGFAGDNLSDENLKECSAELLALAKKELCESGEVTDWYAKGKAEALKDLPRWRKWGNGACGNGSGTPIAIVKRRLGGYTLVDALGIQGEQYIMLSDLEKLPKED